MPTIVKSYLEMPDQSVETRRFVMEPGSVQASGIYGLVYSRIKNAFPDLKDKSFTLFWKDEEEDFVTVSTDDEIQDLMSHDENGICKIYIKVNEGEMPETISQNDDSQERNEKGNHEKSIPMIELTSAFSPPMGCFLPPPPPPPFPFSRPFGGPLGWRGRGRQWPGFHGHHWPHPRWQHKYGHGKHHGGLHHYGGHYYGGPGGHHHHHHHGGKHEWKHSLRAVVPAAHRRWAKGFIQTWRKDNLKNATTTTSDSDGNLDWKITVQEAGIPDVYVEWLLIKLFRWHKKWTSDEMDDISDDNMSEKMDKKVRKALKVSVPMEFRQWTKWYLNSHFRKREAPKFRKNHDGSHGKDWKKCHLYCLVPKEYRVWTKIYIKTWRMEKKLDDPSSPNFIPNDGDLSDNDLDITSDSAIPDAYKQWLEIFLPRWHTWRGQLERNPDIPLKGGMEQFKTTVPMEYRAWVKHYLCMNYNTKKNKYKGFNQDVQTDHQQEKFDKMMQAFKHMWLKKQFNLADCTSSDEGEPESSFQNLTLDSDDDVSKKSKVRFVDEDSSHNTKKQKKQKMEDYAVLMDSDFDEDGEDCPEPVMRKVPMNSSFRHQARQALEQWDGKTVPDNTDDQIPLPPNMYHWMSKMMMKTQMRKMKQEFKAAKREMKAAKKQQKHGHMG